MPDPNTLLQRLRRSLRILEQRRAKYGLDAPVSLILEIDDHQTAITLTEQLAAGHLTETAWREQLQPLLVTIEERQATEPVTTLNMGGVRFGDISNSSINVGNIDASVHIHSPPPQRDKNLTILLSNVRKIWVEDYLHSALLNAIYLDLGLETKQDAVPQPFEELNIRLRQPEQGEQDLPPGTRAIDVYRQAGGSLLILGQPGAGKTTTLATLAGDLVAEAENDPGAPAPVIFNLSSWAAEQKPLAKWLAEELNRQYQVSRKLAERWLAEGELALLLDGLDEVAVDKRKSCVEAINAYRDAEATGPLVVCSRLADYEVLQMRLKLGQAIVLKKLTRQQVEHYFQRLQAQQANHSPDQPSNERTNNLTALFERIWQDEALQELTETPVMLNIITVTYATPEAPPLPEGEGDALRTEIFRAYSERMFERVGRTQIKLLHSKETSLRYLGYLAAQLQAHSLTQFSIGQIRGSWLPVGSVRKRYRWLSGLIVGLLGGLFGGLLSGLPFALFFGLFIGLIVGLIVGLVGGVLGGFYGGMSDEKPVESLLWKWRPALGGLLLGLICGLLSGLLFGLTVEWLGGLILGLFVGLFVGLYFGLLFGLRGEIVNHKVESDQEIHRSQRSALIGALLFGPVLGSFLGFPFGLIVGLHFGLIVGLLSGLLIGLRYGGTFVIQHYIRLYLLTRHNLLPFKLIPFLNQATELIFLQRIGGSYQFIHRSVQEYFAARYEEELES